MKNNKQENCCTPIGQIKRYVDCKGCDRKPKQEKLEKTAEKYIKELDVQHYISQEDFVLGAKWMQERSYSEEEVKFIEILIGFYWVENNSEHPNNLEEWELSQKILKQFKKK